MRNILKVIWIFALLLFIVNTANALKIGTAENTSIDKEESYATGGDVNPAWKEESYAIPTILCPDGTRVSRLVDCPEEDIDTTTIDRSTPDLNIYCVKGKWEKCKEEAYVKEDVEWDKEEAYAREDVEWDKEETKKGVKFKAWKSLKDSVYVKGWWTDDSKTKATIFTRCEDGSFVTEWEKCPPVILRIGWRTGWKADFQDFSVKEVKLNFTPSKKLIKQTAVYQKAFTEKVNSKLGKFSNEKLIEFTQIINAKIKKFALNKRYSNSKRDRKIAIYSALNKIIYEKLWLQSSDDSFLKIEWVTGE